MPVVTHDERKSFLIFLLFVITTAFMITFSQETPSALGILGILWGVFGFLRLIHLTVHQYQNFPKILSLPSQILFGLAQQQQDRMVQTLTRLSQFDIVLWMLGSIAFVGLALFCSFFPSEISIVKTLNVKQELLVNFPIHNQTDPFAMMKGLSFYGIIGIIVFCSLSFSQSRTNVSWAIYTLLPVFLTAAIFTLMFSSAAEPALWPDLSVLTGGGLGQANIMTLLAPEMMAKSGTGLINRFTELGMLGAYGVYLLFIPAVLMLIKASCDDRRTFIKPVIGILCLIFLVILEIFWISAPIIHGLIVIGLSLSSLCWGAAQRQ